MADSADYVQPREVFNPETKQFERNPEWDAQYAENVRRRHSCEGCGYNRPVDLCGRFSFITPKYLCDSCQKILGAVVLGSYAVHIDRDAHG